MARLTITLSDDRYRALKASADRRRRHDRGVTEIALHGMLQEPREPAVGVSSSPFCDCEVGAPVRAPCPCYPPRP